MLKIRRTISYNIVINPAKPFTILYRRAPHILAELTGKIFLVGISALHCYCINTHNGCIWHFQNWEIRPLSSDYKCLKTPPRPYPRQIPPRLFRIWYPSGCGRRILRLLRQFFLDISFVLSRVHKKPVPAAAQPLFCGKFCRWRVRIFDAFGYRVCRKQAFVYIITYSRSYANRKGAYYD